jgi:hypothetical protein
MHCLPLEILDVAGNRAPSAAGHAARYRSGLHSLLNSWLRLAALLASCALRINHGCTDRSGLHHAVRSQVETSETAKFFTETGVLLMNRGPCRHGPVESRRRLLGEN